MSSTSATSEPADTAIRADLRAGHMDGAAFGVMVGLGETYLPAFVFYVGLGEIVAGLVASVPLLAGGVMQLISPAAVARLGSHKRWVLICATTQALTFIPLMAAAATGAISTISVLLVASAYWSAGLAAGPAWNTWMGTLVPRPLRTLYFTNRTRACQCAVLTGFLAGAALLAVGSRCGASLLAFTTIFGAAGLARLFSVAALAAQREPEPMPAAMRRLSIRDWWAFARAGRGRQLLLYIVVVQSIVQFAGPYFTPYMLGQLALSYEAYMALVATAFIAKALALPMWGRFAEHRGTAQLLWVGGVGIVPLSALWILSSHFAWLLMVQCMAGAIWAAYELAFFLMFFEAIPSSERTGMLTLYNFANTSSWVAGSLLGGCVLSALGTTQPAYLILFGLSSVGRLVALGLLYRVPEVRVLAVPVGIRTIGVRPNAASIDNPILPSLPNQRHGDVALVEDNQPRLVPQRSEQDVRAA